MPADVHALRLAYAAGRAEPMRVLRTLGELKRTMDDLETLEKSRTWTTSEWREHCVHAARVVAKFDREMPAAWAALFALIAAEQAGQEQKP